MLKRIESVSNPELAATLLRVALGAVFMSHAYLKFRILGLEAAAGFFEAHGFPGWTVGPVALAEALGGIALVLGVFTRIAAIVLVPVMLGAVATHFPNGWYFTNPNGGWEYVGFIEVALGAQILLGDGAFALGRRFAKPQRDLVPVPQ